ncbi:MAG: AbrB/MazE/SpoVT family DNA-binding domain-containing protein [Deltaproteobacteria bacterium]|nr:MAG: AbrB/MazE/SpoVT family DNA-binding domain-containing protein [Deltaproteobacteria bacterium]TMB28112.1 MAG: AbrB/MazE/SpoVT family DNA-binding domain-containing protein [Deltaproteobacteria bacterium]TMB36455.1 MAG: AbrB/MazE/SpoVT family DNA-binding domain-containing protein [Deltaproteobacteria bacterium]
MRSVVSEKGQVTIPKPVRERLGLRPGTEIEFQAVGGRLVGHKAASGDPFAKWRGRGKLPRGKTADQYLKEIRGAHRD